MANQLFRDTFTPDPEPISIHNLAKTENPIEELAMTNRIRTKNVTTANQARPLNTTDSQENSTV